MREGRSRVAFSGLFNELNSDSVLFLQKLRSLSEHCHEIPHCHHVSCCVGISIVKLLTFLAVHTATMAFFCLLFF